RSWAVAGDLAAVPLARENRRSTDTEACYDYLVRKTNGRQRIFLRRRVNVPELQRSMDDGGQAAAGRPKWPVQTQPAISLSGPVHFTLGQGSVSVGFGERHRL